MAIFHHYVTISLRSLKLYKIIGLQGHITVVHIYLSLMLEYNKQFAVITSPYTTH